MSRGSDELLEKALRLSLEERAALVRRLLLSLDEPPESEVERLWLEEARRRLEELRDGKTRGIPADEVFRRAVTEVS
ncbi:addiction module protein [Deferrisoma palaeochoriense]